jgi:8-oxo-dGTP pyrophosphatase MutT (NUDIX family)
MKYTVGLAFTQNFSHVLMQLKNRGPKHTIGYLNGPGGKHNADVVSNNALGLPGKETLNGCMIREFREETGLQSDQLDWLPFHYERHPSGTELHFYCSNTIPMWKAKVPPGGESLAVVPILPTVGIPNRVAKLEWILSERGYQDTLEYKGLMYNMTYLIPMAITYMKYPEHRYLEG